MGYPRKTGSCHSPAFELLDPVVTGAGQVRDVRIDAFDPQPSPQVDRAREYVAGRLDGKGLAGVSSLAQESAVQPSEVLASGSRRLGS